MTKKYLLQGLDCANCAAKIERAVAKIKGVDEANVNFMTCKMIVDAETFTDEMIGHIKESIHKASCSIELKEI